jgi:hypothetical protein
MAQIGNDSAPQSSVPLSSNRYDVALASFFRPFPHIAVKDLFHENPDRVTPHSTHEVPHLGFNKWKREGSPRKQTKHEKQSRQYEMQI